MNGFVKALPKTKAGLYGAVIISSFIFGFIHVMWDVSSIPVNPLPVFVQIISKTVDAGALGMLLAVPSIIIAVLVLRKLEPSECVIWK